MSGLFFIINQDSGFGKGKKVWKKIKKELELKKVSFRSFHTEYHGHAEVLARQIATIQDYHLKTIIGIGGDGTMNEIVNGLREFSEVKVALLYTGTRKKLGHSSLSSNPSKAIEQIVHLLNRPFKNCDIADYHLVGKSAKRNFISTLGLGLMTKVIEQENMIRNNSTITLLRHVRFMTGFIKVLWNYQPFSLTMQADNEEVIQYENVWILFVSNQPHRWGKMKIASHAKSNDEMLDITIVKNVTRLQLVILLLFNQMNHRVKQDGLIEFTCEKVSIITEHFQEVAADGEIVGESPVTVLVKKSQSELLI